MTMVTQWGCVVDSKEKPPLDEATLAAYEYVGEMKSKADGYNGASPMWFGWAIREAFIAGTKWKKTVTTKPKFTTEQMINWLYDVVNYRPTSDVEIGMAIRDFIQEKSK